MGGLSEGLLMYFFFGLYLCVLCSVFAACCPYLMVLFGFHYVASGGSVQSGHIGTNCPAGDQKPSAAGVS